MIGKYKGPISMSPITVEQVEIVHDFHDFLGIEPAAGWDVRLLTHAYRIRGKVVIQQLRNTAYRLLKGEVGDP